MKYFFETKDKHEYETAINGVEAFLLLHDIDQELRALLKYGTSAEFDKDITRDELAEKIRSIIHENTAYQKWLEE